MIDQIDIWEEAMKLKAKQTDLYRKRKQDALDTMEEYLAKLK